MRVTAVVVNYDSAPDIFDCLDSLRASEHPVEIVVVDNASTDGSPDVLATRPDVRLVRSSRNVGFAAGVNLGVAAVRAAAAPGEGDEDDAVLLINPDATVEPGTVGRLASTLAADARRAAVGPLVRNPDGSVQPSKRSFPTWPQAALHATVGVFWPENPGTRAYVCADAPPDRPSPVGWLSGSVLLLRRSAFDAVGGFDDDFFFYVEDVDLCRRLSDAGWELWFDPRARAVHAWGGSTSKAVRALWLHHRNLFRYVHKHNRGWRRIVEPAVAGGLGLRFLLSLGRLAVLRRSQPAHQATRHAHADADDQTVSGNPRK